MPGFSQETSSLLTMASREAMVPQSERCRGPLLARAEVERLLPHRDPFLFLDRITFVDPQNAMIVCRYDLDHATSILAGHFPRTPLWPGVLQVEAIGQAGLCLANLLREAAVERSESGLGLTNILGARFIRPVTPSGGELEIVSRVLPDGLFNIIVGQCLQGGSICSAAALRGIDKERQE